MIYFRCILISLFLFQPILMWSQEDKAVPEKTSTLTPRQTLKTFFEYIQATDFAGAEDSAAQTFYVKDRTTEEARTLARKLNAYIDAEGYIFELLDAPDTSSYKNPSTGAEEYHPFPEEADIYLVKRGEEWLWSRKTVKAIPGLYDGVFPQDEFGQSGSTFRFSLESPYTTIISHIYFLLHDKEDQYHPDSSAMTLYVADSKGEEAQELASKLLQYYNGRGYFIQPDYLPDDPNYLDSLTGKHIYHPVPEVDEVYVIKIGKKWVYSQRTVQAIPKLFAETYPLGTLDWIPEWGKRNVLGMQIWQWLGILMLIILTFTIHRLLTVVFRYTMNVLSQRVVHETVAIEFLEKVARPLSLLVLTLLLVKVIPMLQLNISVNRWLILILRVCNPIFLVLIFYYLVDMIAAFMARRAAKTEGTLDDQLVPLIRKILKGLVVILGGIYIMNQLNVDVTALVAGLSIGGLALALASQDTVKNFLGSLMIILDRPFQVGDWIMADGQEGIVEEVSIRSTRIRTFSNSLIYIPNATLADTAVNNMGMRIYRRFNMKIALTYDTPPDLIEAFVEGLKKLTLAHPFTRKDYYEIHFNDMNTFSLDVLFYVFFQVDSWTKELQGRHDLLLGIMRLGADLGINFAFPTQTLQIETLPGQEGLSPSYPNSRDESDRQTAAYLQKFKKEVAKRMDTRGHRLEQFAGDDDL